jgi:hypothetical protein
MTACLQKTLICFPWGLSNLSKLNSLLQSYQSTSPKYAFVYKPVYRNWLHLIQDTAPHHSKVFTVMLLSQRRKDKTWEPSGRVTFFLVPKIFFFFNFVHEVRHRLLFLSFRYLSFCCVIDHNYYLRYTEFDDNTESTVIQNVITATKVFMFQSSICPHI